MFLFCLSGCIEYIQKYKRSNVIAFTVFFVKKFKMQQFQLKFIFIVLNFILVFKKKRFMGLYRVCHLEMVFFLEGYCNQTIRHIGLQKFCVSSYYTSAPGSTVK